LKSEKPTKYEKYKANRLKNKEVFKYVQELKDSFMTPINEDDSLQISTVSPISIKR
jgi:hypothetical protein